MYLKEFLKNNNLKLNCESLYKNLYQITILGKEGKTIDYLYSIDSEKISICLTNLIKQLNQRGCIHSVNKNVEIPTKTIQFSEGTLLKLIVDII